MPRSAVDDMLLQHVYSPFVSNQVPVAGHHQYSVISIRYSVFARAEAQIGFISLTVNFTFIQGTSHCTAWFMSMGAIVELTMLDQATQFGKIPIELFGLGVPERKGLPAGRVGY